MDLAVTVHFLTLLNKFKKKFDITDLVQLSALFDFRHEIY